MEESGAERDQTMGSVERARVKGDYVGKGKLANAVESGGTGSGNDGDDDLRRMMADLSSPPPACPSAIEVIVKDEGQAVSTGESTALYPVAQSSPSYAVAQWAATLSSGGKSTAGIGFTTTSTCSSVKPSIYHARHDFVAAVQAIKRKRKGAPAGQGKTKKKKPKMMTKDQPTKSNVEAKDNGRSSESPTGKKIGGRRSFPTSFTPEELEGYFMPLRLGWKRELAYRKTQRKGSMADVYYIAPNGIRLRSLPEVDDYLRTASEKVTRVNFTFRRVTLGFDEIAGAEIVRGMPSPELAKLVEAEKGQSSAGSPSSPHEGAKKGKGKLPTSTTGASSMTSEKAETVNADSAESPIRKGQPSTPIQSSNGDNSPLSPSKKNSSGNRMKMLRKVAISESQRKQHALMKVTTVESTPADKTEVWDLAPTPSILRNKARKSIWPPPPPARRVSSRSSSIRDDSETSGEHDYLVSNCSNDACPIRANLTVPCVTCLRLFHRQCVSTKGRILPTLQFECFECSHFSSDGHNEKEAISEDLDDRTMVGIHAQIRESVGTGEHKRKVIVQRFPMASSTGVVDSNVRNAGPTAALSTNVGTDGLAAIQSPVIAYERRRETTEFECHSPPLDMAIDSEPTETTKVEIIINGAKQFLLMSNGQSAPIAFPLDRYNDYVNGLVSIFSFLPVKDLLNVRLVCRAWNEISHSPKVWKCAHLKGCRITSVESWRAAVEFLCKCNVEELDLSGCGQGYASMRQFTESALPALSQFVHGFRFGHCFPKLLDATAKACKTNLRSITMTLTKDPYTSTEWISSSAFANLALCRDLQELRLSARDTTGKKQRVYINGEGLAALALLTKLRSLVLFDIRALDAKVFKFLDSLTCLRVLEIGDCQCWTRETYAKFRALVHLRRLRLEYFEPGSAGDAFADSLSALQELREIELVKYTFDYSYASTVSTSKPLSVLSELPKLHTVRLYPHLDGKWPTPTWRRTVEVLPNFARLKRFELGVTLDEDTTMAKLPEMDKSATLKPPFMCTRPKQPQKIGYVNKEALREWIAEKLPNTVVNVVDLDSASDLATTREAKWW